MQRQPQVYTKGNSWAHREGAFLTYIAHLCKHTESQWSVTVLDGFYKQQCIQPSAALLLFSQALFIFTGLLYVPDQKTALETKMQGAKIFSQVNYNPSKARFIYLTWKCPFAPSQCLVCARGSMLSPVCSSLAMQWAAAAPYRHARGILLPWRSPKQL